MFQMNVEFWCQNFLEFMKRLNDNKESYKVNGANGQLPGALMYSDYFLAKKQILPV